MPNFTLMGWMFLAWSILTGLLALLVIYRSVVGMKEDDQIFLDAAESQFAEEQRAVLARLNRIEFYVKGLGIASGGLLAAMIGLVVYRVVRTAF